MDAATDKTVTASLIDTIIQRLLAVSHPDRIILFGSAARGQMTPDSDIDLLVLEKAPAQPRRHSVRLRDALRGLGYPFDVMVMATERFEETKGVIGGLAYPANKYGRVIYDAAG
jgi:predicted nucleotidyltransferase